MAAVAANDTGAQEQLVRRLSPRVHRVSQALCGTEADPDDTAQLAMLEILRCGGSYRVEASIEHWADRITIRCALHALRHERRRRGLLRRWLVPGRLPWGTSHEVRDSERPGIDTLLSKIPYERQEALILHHVLGYTVGEIGNLTSSPRGTVKSRLARGKKQLRELLELEWSPDSDNVFAPPEYSRSRGAPTPYTSASREQVRTLSVTSVTF